MLIASNGVIIRMFSAEINSLGRATQGVTLMRSDDGATVIGIAKTPHEEEKEEATEGEGTENTEAPAENAEVTE